jgi:ADP-ribose pyrophosphatase
MSIKPFLHKTIKPLSTKTFSFSLYLIPNNLFSTPFSRALPLQFPNSYFFRSMSCRTPAFLHEHARSSNKSYPPRFPVNDAEVPWSVSLPHYSPPDYTAENVIKKSPDYKQIERNNQEQAKDLQHRHSYECSTLSLDEKNGRPMDPFGRTGLEGRGKLYYWGPNHAADALITASERDGQFSVLLIKRSDTKQYALPGGMVDKGEEKDKVTTAKREFAEEVLGIQGDVKDQAKQTVEDLFDREKILAPSYAGYIDDPRNTDNSWMESFVVHRNLQLSEPGEKALYDQLNKLLNAGDDAVGVEWVSMGDKNKLNQLYASHKQIITRAIDSYKEKSHSKL